MVRKSTFNFQHEGISEEVMQAIQQLGKLRDLELENYISKLIKQADSIKFAQRILNCLETINKQSTRIVEKDKLKYHSKINHLNETAQDKSLTPMEKRFLYEEIAELIRDMGSIPRYWLQKSITGVKYVGAASAVVAAALFLRKGKKEQE